MTTQRLPQSSVRSSRFLTVIATILSIPFLSVYWMGLSGLFPDTVMVQHPEWLTTVSSMLYLPFALFAYILFTSLYGYILATLASIAAVAVALVKERPGRLLSAWLLTIIVAVLAFPIFFRYQPALAAAPGHSMQLVTNPGFFGGIVKASQNAVEQIPCDYELLGWSTDNQIVYQANCRGETQIWQYSPTQPDDHRQVPAIPADLRTSVVPEDTLLGMVRAQIRPRAYEASSRSTFLKSNGMISPNGQWVAVVTQHVYGTQDVIILTTTEG